MSKAVLKSIRPNWCEKIVNEEKTIEVSKTRPKIETPFKCYIYCTSVKHIPLIKYVGLYRGTGGRIDEWQGKVIGEFICDGIEIFEYVDKLFKYGAVDSDIKWDGYEDSIVFYNVEISTLRATCLTEEELLKYGRSTLFLYGWHITYLKIYDIPKELSEFYLAKDCKDYHGGYSGCDDFCGVAENNDCRCGHKRLTRPPQSWCYVEELNG